MDDVRGKGPFARRSPPTRQKTFRWVAPPVEADRESVKALLSFVKRKNDTATFRILASLACIRPEFRLARNLGSVARCLATKSISDALQEGLLPNEVGVLSNLEQWGIPFELLGVAHALLDVRARQELIIQLGDDFNLARTNTKARIDPIDLEE